MNKTKCSHSKLAEFSRSQRKNRYLTGFTDIFCSSCNKKFRLMEENVRGNILFIKIDQI